MPSYNVIKRGFFDGRLYDPVGKRPVLHTEKPFPSKDKKEQVPDWLEAIQGETTVTVGFTGPTVTELKEQLTKLDVEFKGNASKAVLTELLETAKLAAKVDQDNKDIADASFMGTGEANSTVETL